MLPKKKQMTHKQILKYIKSTLLTLCVLGYKYIYIWQNIHLENPCFMPLHRCTVPAWMNRSQARCWRISSTCFSLGFRWMGWAWWAPWESRNFSIGKFPPMFSVLFLGGWLRLHPNPECTSGKTWIVSNKSRLWYPKTSRKLFRKKWAMLAWITTWTSLCCITSPPLPWRCFDQVTLGRWKKPKHLCTGSERAKSGSRKRLNSWVTKNWNWFSILSGSSKFFWTLLPSPFPL